MQSLEYLPVFSWQEGPAADDKFTDTTVCREITKIDSDTNSIPEDQNACNTGSVSFTVWDVSDNGLSSFFVKMILEPLL